MKKIFEQAIQTGEKVNIMYVSQLGTVSKRKIYIISCTDECVVSYCYMRENIRTFNMKNILAVEQIKQKTEVYV